MIKLILAQTFLILLLIISPLYINWIALVNAENRLEIVKLEKQINQILTESKIQIQICPQGQSPNKESHENPYI